MCFENQKVYITIILWVNASQTLPHSKISRIFDKREHVGGKKERERERTCGKQLL